MTLGCPYTELELLVALLGASKKLEDYEKKHGSEAVLAKLDEAVAVQASGAEVNKGTAEFHGITVDQLINSPNYSKLKDEYDLSRLDQVISFLKSEFVFDEKEAWAVVAKSKGVI